MIASHRFVLLATSISAALLLSACQPAADSQSAPVEEATPPMTDMTHAEHENMSHDTSVNSENVTDDAQMTDMLKDYTKSMTSMHDEMMIGMGYNDPDTAFAKACLGIIAAR